jgi:hypothetical protein
VHGGCKGAAPAGPGAVSAPPPQACCARSAPLCSLPLRIYRAGSSNLQVCIRLSVNLLHIAVFCISNFSNLYEPIAFRRIVEIDFSSLTVTFKYHPLLLCVISLEEDGEIVEKENMFFWRRTRRRTRIS